MEVAIEDFLGNSSMTADLSDVFNNLIGHRFVFPDYGDRRASFMDNIRSFSNAYTGIHVFLSRWGELDHEYFIFSSL